MPQLDFSTASSGASRKIGVFDPEMPALRGVFDTNRMRNNLRQRLPSLFPEERSSVGRVNFQDLPWRPGRRLVLEIALRTTTGWLRFVGKVYCEDRPDVFEAMKKIWQSSINRGAGFSIPRPIAYLASLRLLLQEKSEGLLAKRVFLEGNSYQCIDAAERCALWLARFQVGAPRQGKLTDVQRILRHAERRVRFIVEACMPFASKARKLFDGLAASPPTLNTMCARHGDYKPDHQFLLPQGGAITFDWDCYDMADPCRDAAMFLIYLERLALGERGAAQNLKNASQAFLKTYWAPRRPALKFDCASIRRRCTCKKRSAMWANSTPDGWREPKLCWTKVFENSKRKGGAHARICHGTWGLQ